MSNGPGPGGFFPSLLRHPRLVLAAWVALAVCTAPGLLRLTYDNSPEAYFVRDHEALKDYERFVDRFGDLGALRLWATGDGIWTPEGLTWLGAVEEGAPRIVGVVGASGPWSYRAAKEPRAEWPPADLPDYRKELVEDALLRSAGLVSGDGSAVVVLMAVSRLDSGEREALLATLEGWLEARPPGIEAGLAGLVTINRALDRALTSVLLRQFPLGMLLGAFLVALSLRSLRDTVIALLFAGICQTVVLGTMGYRGAPLNVVTSVLPLLIFVLALATGVHLLADVRERSRGASSAREATRATYRNKAWPVIWTAVTTGVAFGSLAWSDSPPVRSLGLWSLAGIAVVLLGALTLYPVLLSEGRRPAATHARSAFESRARALGERAVSFALARGGWVHAIFGTLFVLALAGVPRLEVETGVLDYFGPGNRERRSVEALERLGTGPVSAELVLELDRGSFEDAEMLDKLDRLTRRLRASPPAVGALSVADLPASEAPFFRRARAVLLSDDGRSARVSIAVPLRGYRELQPFFESVVESARKTLPEASGFVTGPYPMVLLAQRTLLSAMVVSLGITLLIVVGVLLLLVRDRRLALAAVVPNLWPVATALGLMGWLGVAVDSGTMMIAAVVLGLAVDDTLHFLGGLRSDGPQSSAAQAVRTTLVRLAPAHLLTSSVLVAGLTTLAFSGFLPVARFGALSALAVAAALAGDLLWVPALAAGTSRSASDRAD